LGAFTSDLRRYGELPLWEIDPCVYVESSEVAGKNAVVHMRVQYYDVCTGIEVRNLSFTPFRVDLRREGGEWKIMYAGMHFAGCWADAGACDQGRERAPGGQAEAA
jgi:hypothetical protein